MFQILFWALALTISSMFVLQCIQRGEKYKIVSAALQVLAIVLVGFPVMSWTSWPVGTQVIVTLSWTLLVYSFEDRLEKWLKKNR